MALGPLAIIVVTFPVDSLLDGIRVTLDRLQADRGMRVVDVLVVRADAAGCHRLVELGDLPGLRSRGGLATGLLPQTDIDEVAAMVRPGVDAVAILLEHRWLRELATPVSTLRGSIVALSHIAAVPMVHLGEPTGVH